MATGGCGLKNTNGSHGLPRGTPGWKGKWLSITREEIANTRLQSAGGAALIQALIMGDVHSFPALNPKAPGYAETNANLTMEERVSRALVMHKLASAYSTATATRLSSHGAPRVKEDRVQSGVLQVTVQWEDEESVNWDEVGEGVAVPPVVDPAVAVDPA